ncbi:MAG TPA: barstar family protein [Flavobacteriales bacterium]|nr:barstar family protein [Flavobacteriales bacterium]
MTNETGYDLGDWGLDLQTLQHGAICLYHNSALLATDLNWYRSANYRVAEFDALGWTEQTAHEALAKGLGFPDYYGRNLNAFNDCLGDMYSRDNPGLLLVFRHFDDISMSDPRFSWGLLDVIAHVSRHWLLTGQRLIGIAQSNNPHLSFERVGGTAPFWNSKEWLDANRVAKQ